MPGFLFPSDDALVAALRGGAVPPEVASAPVALRRPGAGGVELWPLGPLPLALEAGLRGWGVARVAGEPPEERVGAWAEAVPCRSAPLPTGPIARVLLEVLAGGPGPVCAELLRLGCARVALAALPDGGALLDVHAPPWFLLARALEGEAPVRAYTQRAPGVWAQLGAAHPVEALLRPRTGLLLLPASGPWRWLPDGPWRPLSEVLELEGAAPPDALAVGTLGRVVVRPRLVEGGGSPAVAAFLVEQGVAVVERLAATLPQAALERLLFAVAGDTVLLRPRAGQAVGAGELPGRPLARVAELPNLLVPLGWALEPPLERETLRAWLAPEEDVLTWLEPSPGGVRPVRLPLAAFKPLSEWVDYVLDGAATALTAWARGATFALEAFVVEEPLAPALAAPVAPPVRAALPEPAGAGPWPSAPGAAPPAEPLRPPPRPARPSGVVLPHTPAMGIAPVPRPAVEAEARAAATLVLEAAGTPTEVEESLAREEAAFLELEAPADSAERRAAWVRLAELYGRAQRPREAGLAWSHAVWDAPESEAPALAARWAATAGVQPEAVWGLSSPLPEQARGAIAHLVVAALAPGPAGRPAGAAALLARVEEGLDVRSAWLGRWADARLAGGDALALARARDATLARLQRGLSLERDVPRLVRVSGQGGGRGTERAGRVTAQLEQLWSAFDKTPRKRTLLEAPWPLTRPYVGLVFAWGLARLGAVERARRLREESVRALDANHPVHRFLAQAYSARIEHALESSSPETPLPVEVAAQLAAFDASTRYKVDKLRQASHVLEPQERLDSIDEWVRRQGAQARGERGTGLKAVLQPEALLAALASQERAAVDPALPDEERARLLEGMLDALPRLPEVQAAQVLPRFVGLSEGLPGRLKLKVLEGALTVAGHFGRAPLVKQYVVALTRLLGSLRQDELLEAGPGLVAGVRSLRRVGLKDEAAALFERAQASLKGEEARTLQARLGLAAGFAYLGQTRQAHAVLEEALARLGRESESLLMPDRLRLTRAAAQVLGHSPLEVALPGLLRLSQQLPWITDGYSTRDLFCLSVVEFADALVLGHVGDDLSLSEATRRFLEEDEYLVRRRIQRDVKGATP